MSAVGKFFKKVGTGIWSGIKTVGSGIATGAKKVAGFVGNVAPKLGEMASNIGGMFGPKGAAIGAGIGMAGQALGSLFGKKQPSQPAIEGPSGDQPSFGAPPSMRGDMGNFIERERNLGRGGRGFITMRPAVMPRMGYGEQDMSTSGFGGMGGGGMQQEMPAMMPRRRFGGMGMM